MAEIIKFIPKKYEPDARRVDYKDLPFQLLFFTGVRYERESVPAKPTPRKKIRKA
jgi:hypothetical protein